MLHVSCFVAIALLFTLSAEAQTSSSRASSKENTAHPSSDFISQTQNTWMRVSKVIGAGVIGLDHARLGAIEDVMISRDGSAEAIVIRAGSVLGLGGKNVAVPFTEVLWNTGNVKAGDPPVSSMKPENAPPASEAAAERMPGAQVTPEALASTSHGQPGKVDESTGSVSASDSQRGAATVLVVGPNGGPEQAMVRVTKADLEKAPEFRPGSQ